MAPAVETGAPVPVAPVLESVGDTTAEEFVAVEKIIDGPGDDAVCETTEVKTGAREGDDGAGGIGVPTAEPLNDVSGKTTDAEAVFDELNDNVVATLTVCAVRIVLLSLVLTSPPSHTNAAERYSRRPKHRPSYPIPPLKTSFAPMMRCMSLQFLSL